MFIDPTGAKDIQQIAGSSQIPDHVRDLEDEFYSELEAAERAGAGAGDEEPPLFVMQPHWEPWREDQVFLPRKPVALPRRPMPVGHSSSAFRQLLAPLVVASSLALIALTHGAVASRVKLLFPRIDMPTADAPTRTRPPPFSLTGVWRQIDPWRAEQTALSQPPTIVIVAAPAEAPTTATTQAVEAPDPPRPIEAPAHPEPTLPDFARPPDLLFQPIAVDGICAMTGLAQPHDEASPPAPQSVPGTPLTELYPMEPWGVQPVPGESGRFSGVARRMLLGGSTEVLKAIAPNRGRATQTIVTLPVVPARIPSPKVVEMEEEEAPAPAKPKQKPAAEPKPKPVSATKPAASSPPAPARTFDPFRIEGGG